MNRPLLLLLGTGAALGLNFPIGKLAMAAGISPALWAAMISAGTGLVMLFIVAVTERQGSVAHLHRLLRDYLQLPLLCGAERSSPIR